ncbi:hypothetical protein I4Q36_07135 [Tuanshanicoccus lijuaniae]|uniref:hypothetical protein n=1 Tax=Aerococcaceae bacterium zg-1292 TaxID=2774330 RepID=UPI0019378EB4|nr:hypothetical protein [Aerococcaceae bacterium zg-1292]QQA36583.1 hypothetical protein I4Q36_07135 [Aerococcaceae bacterium zg-1292]
MISEMDVVKLKMPYPNISSGLAVKAHMYICKRPGENKETLKIQSVKNKHRINGYPCSNYYVLSGSSVDNPCARDSFVDLDKQFIINNIMIPRTLLARSALSKSCYYDIIQNIHRSTLQTIMISASDFLRVNTACKPTGRIN